MNESTAKELLALLASQFGVCGPNFRFNRTNRGLYYPGTKTVTIARPYQNWGKRTCEHSLLHEFAHHLADERAIKANLRPDGHGNRFKNALWETVTAYYGDARKYPWGTEYTTVRAYGERRLSE